MMKLRWVPVLTFTAVIVGLAPTANAVSYSLTDNVKMRDNPTATSSYSAIAVSYTHLTLPTIYTV